MHWIGIAFIIVFGCYAIKNYRIFIAFKEAVELRESAIGDWMSIVPIVVIILFEVVYFTIWQLCAPQTIAAYEIRFLLRMFVNSTSL